MNKILCFHKPEEKNGWLSNWYPSYFELNGIKFSSMEQYMMHKKAVMFRDFDKAEKILLTNDVSIIKEYGRQVTGYNDVIWNGNRQIVVYQGLLAKFTQNEFLRINLKKTGSSILAECAVHDKIWGIGLSMFDPNRYNIKKWTGQNLLGFSIMQVREKI